MKLTEAKRIELLKNFLVESEGYEVNEIKEIVSQSWDEKRLTVSNGMEYMVCTDDEATSEANDYIKSSLWAFNASFIIDQSNVEHSDSLESVLQKMQSELCEDANALVLAIIDDLEEFQADAILTDGRGNFITSYDGEELEYTFDDETYYLYRME